MKKFYFLLLSSLIITSITNVSAQTAPCTLTGASIYIDHTSGPWMMNATVNGAFVYDYSWIDTNGVVVGTANQIPFYTQWCVTITDLVTGCDTIICQDCTIDSTALCMCTMIYMPVCGCNGVQYANSCLADCADVPWSPAIPSGQLGGWLPCASPSWDCVNGACIDPTTGLGQYASLSACLLDSCIVMPPSPSWDCVGNVCYDPGNGMGMYVSQVVCTAACVISTLEEHTTNKELLKVTDLLGRETKGAKNEVLFYIYDDGTVEKKIVIK